MINRPFSVWWDFRWANGVIKYIVVQTDHPSYRHVDYIYKFDINECEDENGFINMWEDTWFRKFEDDILSGRISLHKIMTKQGKRNEN